MAEKNIKSRIIHKHDTAENWAKATSFIPKKGEIIVYDIDADYSYERFKIGDGKTLVSALPFADDAVKESIDALNKTIDGVDSRVDAVSALVGDVAVSEQINDAIADKADSDHVHDVATISANGFMSAADKEKLDGIAEGASNHEAYLRWGGRNISGNISPIDAASSNLHSGNRFQFANPEGITIEYSTDGNTWADYEASDAVKTRLVSGIGDALLIGKRNTSTTVNDKLRITFDASSMGLYMAMKKLLINISTNYATGCNVTVERAMKGSSDTFITIGNYPISGWSGWNSIPVLYTFGGNESQTVAIAKLRLTFGITGVNSAQTANALTIKDIIALGDVYWYAPSTMAKTGHLYSYDENKNATFPAKVTATSFSGNATSATKATQDASGNVITSTYATKTELNDVSSLVGDTAVADQINSAINNSGHIKSTGDTMTGPLKTMGLTSNAIQGVGESKIVVLPSVPYSLIDESHTSETYFEKLLVWICDNYPEHNNTTFIGTARPNSLGTAIINIYDTNNRDAESGLPQYAGCIYIPLPSSSTIHHFGTYAYTFYWNSTSMVGHTHPEDKEVYVGPTKPTDPNVKVWINTAEEGTGVIPVLPRATTISLPKASWTGSSAPYSQTVSINTVTSATKIDLQPTVAQITSLQNDDIALMAENIDGTVKIYSFGGKPSADMTMQVLLTEVSYV